jgi:hypothetical protein
MIPIYINCRDRVSELQQLVAWLEKAGQERIILLDNDSTWEPLLDYLRASPHEVRYLNENAGSKAIWLRGMTPDEPYIYTDPDLIPIEDCPLDAIDRLAELLTRYPHPKAGLGLYLDDLPDDFHSMAWERSLVAPERLLEAGIYDSLIDTTFALYRAGEVFGYSSLRLGSPYQMRHTSWYPRALDDENRHYLSRARPGPEGSSWAEQGVS